MAMACAGSIIGSAEVHGHFACGVRKHQIFVKAVVATSPKRLHNAPKKVLPSLRWLGPGIFILAFSIYAYCANPTVTFSSVGTGITLTGNSGTLGNVNGLGVGTLSTGTSLFAPSPTPPITGAFYYSPINVTVGGLSGAATGLLTAYASTNFGHPIALTGYTCTTGCTGSYTSYTQLSTNSATPTTIAAATTGTVEVWLGVFVSSTNGTNGYSGADSVNITFTVTDSNNGKTGTSVVTLGVTAQTAVEMALTTATGGLSVSPASDFAINFQNVNGLGINPAAGLTATSVSGGYVYQTPYTITPIFSGFTATTTGTLKVQLKTAFGSPTMIYLEDSASSGGPYSAITANAQTITAAASSNTGVTRYLGLFVSNANGAGAFTGNDSSTLTYTLTVP
jgi:hypothetical protein